MLEKMWVLVHCRQVWQFLKWSFIQTLKKLQQCKMMKALAWFFYFQLDDLNLSSLNWVLQWIKLNYVSLSLWKFPDWNNLNHKMWNVQRTLEIQMMHKMYLIFECNSIFFLLFFAFSNYVLSDSFFAKWLYGTK